MTNLNKPKVFLCYAGEDQSLLSDFVRRLEEHNDLELHYYDQAPNTANMHAQFRHFASDCDVAILLVNARFTNLGSYANKYEMPILLERQARGEVIVIGVRVTEADITAWNTAGAVYFFQLHNDALPRGRRPDANGLAFNCEFANYEGIVPEDRNRFHLKLKGWIDLL